MSSRLIMPLSLTLILLLSGCTEKTSTHSEKPTSNVPVALAAPIPTPNEEKTACGMNKAHEDATTNLISTKSTNSKQNVIYSGTRSLKRIALTFDDGPDRTYTSKILDILKQNDVKATFFVGISPARILANVKKETRPGAILLEHCSGGRGGNLSNTIQALPQIISYLKKEGYTFVTIPELLNPT